MVEVAASNSFYDRSASADLEIGLVSAGHEAGSLEDA